MNPLNFFNTTYKKFQLAEKQSGKTYEYFFNIAGHIICLKFTSKDFVPIITKALKHIETKKRNPHLTICFWQGTHKDIKPSLPPFNINDYNFQGLLKTYTNDSIYTLRENNVDSIEVLNINQNIGLYWIENTSQIPYWVQSFPLRTMLHWYFTNKNFQPIHAAAIGYKGNGILLTGKGGSGKSTTALLGLESGLDYLGDDYVLIKTDKKPSVFCLYNTAKVHFDNLHRVSFLKKHLTNPIPKEKDEKALFFLNDIYKNKIKQELSLKAIFVPKITNNIKTKIVPTSPAVALTALAPTTIFHLPKHSKTSFQKVSTLTRQLPCYILELGHNIKETSKIIRNFLYEL